MSCLCQTMLFVNKMYCFSNEGQERQQNWIVFSVTVSRINSFTVMNAIFEYGVASSALPCLRGQLNMITLLKLWHICSITRVYLAT